MPLDELPRHEAIYGFVMYARGISWHLLDTLVDRKAQFSKLPPDRARPEKETLLTQNVKLERCDTHDPRCDQHGTPHASLRPSTLP